MFVGFYGCFSTLRFRFWVLSLKEFVQKNTLKCIFLPVYFQSTVVQESCLAMVNAGASAEISIKNLCAYKREFTRR
jgi:hypothetical protein